jgi:hypothetical protein
VLIQQIKN